MFKDDLENTEKILKIAKDIPIRIFPTKELKNDITGKYMSEEELSYVDVNDIVLIGFSPNSNPILLYNKEVVIKALKTKKRSVRVKWIPKVHNGETLY